MAVTLVAGGAAWACRLVSHVPAAFLRDTLAPAMPARRVGANRSLSVGDGGLHPEPGDHVDNSDRARAASATLLA